MTTIAKTSRRYRSALRAHLKSGPQASLIGVRELGILSKSAGLSTLGLAKLHERILVADILPGISTARRAALTGKTWFSKSITHRFERINPNRSQGRPAHPAVRLTVRESEVLQLVAEGNANKTMASILGIGIKTVEKHREHLMAKLDIHDTAGLTRYAIASGVIESPVQPTWSASPVR